MRIRRNIIAPLILTIGAVGSLVAVPAVTALTAVAPPPPRRPGAPPRTLSATTGEIKRPASRPPSIPQSAAGCWLSPCNS